MQREHTDAPGLGRREKERARPTQLVIVTGAGIVQLGNSDNAIGRMLLKVRGDSQKCANEFANETIGSARTYLPSGVQILTKSVLLHFLQ